MRPNPGKHRPAPHNRPLYRAFSFILSTALVILPVLPSRVALAAPSERRPAPSEALRAAPAPLPASPLAPSITATKVDSFSDPDGDGKAEPGQVITYTVTVTNNGTDATNVTFTDTVDPNTTLVPGSVSTQPVASNDSYGVLGNVRIQPNAAAGLLANDCDPDNGGPCSSAGLTASGPTSSAQGGNVSVNADGSFSYNPPAGYEGPDSFNYTVTDASGKTDTATANFTVNEVVWFVNNAAPAGGDGRLTSPFNSLAPVNGAGGAGDPDEPSDVIYVLQGAGPYSGGIILENNQRLVGQGTGLDAVLAAFGIGVPPHSDARPAATGAPTLADAGGDVITLAGDNVIMYLNAAASAPGSSAIFGGGTGGSTAIDNVGASAGGNANGLSLIGYGGALSVTNGTVSANSVGTAVLINGGSANITFTNNPVSQNGGRVVDIQSRTGGAVTFNGSTTVTGTNGITDAVRLLSNSGTITFAGPVQLNTNAAGARGLVADSGTVNMTNGGNAVSATGGAAVDIENLAVNIVFATTFSTNSTGRGLRVDNVSGAASFGNTAVNGSGNTGVLLTGNSAALTFADLDIAPAAGQRALHAVDNAGVITSTSGTVVTTNAVAAEITALASTPLNVRLTSVSAAGAPSGIVLTNTTSSGSPGGFSVNGDGTGARNGSGGAITATTDDGVRLTNAAGVALRSMNLTNNGDTVSASLATNESAAGEHAVEAVNSSGITLSGVLVQNPAASGLLGLELTGTNRVSSDSLFTGVNNAQTHGIFLSNSAANLALFEINDSDFTNSATGASMVFVTNAGAANVTVEVENGSVFEGLNSQALTFSAGATAGTTGTLTSTANGNIFRNAAAGAENNVGSLVANGALHVSTIENNLFDNVAENGLIAGASIIRTQNSGGRMEAVVRNNTVQNISYAAGGRHVIGHIFEPIVYSASNFSDLLVEGNTAAGVTYAGATNREFIFVDYRPTASGGDIKILGNNWNMPTAGSAEAIELRFRQTNASTVDLLVDGNGLGTGASHYTGSDQFVDIDAEAAATVNATVTNNSFKNLNAAATQPVLDFATEAAGSSMCVNVSGNTLAGNPAATNTVTLNETAGTMNVTQASAAAVSAANGGATVSVLGAPAFGQPPCSLPTNAAPETTSVSGRDALGDRAETAAARGAQPGLPAGGLAASFDKTPRGFANSERGQVLGAGEETSKTVRAAAPLAAFAGETISIPVGTLKAGDSVTISFQVTVADPFTGAQPQVSNQGAVTADGGVSVLTDDPSEPGAADPTVTPVLSPPTVNVNDATVAEPATGSTDMLFTVTLSHTYSQAVTVNYQTANGGANPATAGTDYTASGGTVTFAAGETVKTVAVPVLADGTPAEGGEHFLVSLSNPDNATVGDGQATGTITDESAASQLIISELRTNGPNGATDDFVELLNTTDNDITVASTDGSAGWSIVKRGADCSATPVLVGVIPNGTVIPARGNYLLTGSGYSLAGYPAGSGTTATGDAALSSDLELNANVGLFTVANVSNISSVNRLDAVGFGANTGGNCDLLREGNTLPQIVGFSVDYSFVRKVDKGLTVDTTDNASDFVFVDTNGTSMGAGQRLGAPGPENLSSPRGPVPCSATAGAAEFGRELIDPTVSAAAAPNVVRDSTSDPAENSTFGTLDFRRTWTNNTGAPVTRLRFRITDLSTFPSPSGTADLRARTSSAVVVTTAGGPKTVLGTTLEQPPFQPNGGGINSSLSAGTVTLATPLAAGASVNLRFLFGIQQTGDYDIGVVLESAPEASGKDFWRLTGHTDEGGHTDGGCNKPPVANAGPDQTLECSDGQASVTLDGSGSTDPDGDTPLAYEWSENGNPLGTGQTLNVSLPVGSHTVTLTVTDPSGDSSQDAVTINVVDTTAPQVTAPPDVTVYTGPGASSCSATVGDAQLGTAAASDSCQGDLTPQRTGVPAGNAFPIGTTQVTYTATDAAGNVGSDVQNVTVIDNTPPVVTPPANVVTSADPGSCSANVNPGQATASDNCSVQSVNGTRSDNQPLNAPYPVGTTTITWTATDASGNQATAQQTVTVQDNQPPAVSSSVAVTTMGPPFNHALINVGLSATASDNCGTVGPLQVFVYSDEDDGAGPHSPDATNIGLGTLKLRRERDGGSNGRVYLIVVKATDSSGNTSVSVNTVTVPLSNSAGDQASVNAQAAAAAAYASANGGAPPAGYFVVGP